MLDFLNAIFSEDAEERDEYWRRYNILTPLERTEYDRLVLQAAVDIDHTARFAELSETARKRLESTDGV